jgi:ketosteroid isomerase-like protein
LGPPRGRAIADEWVAAFNSHDVERILSHYAESIELRSRLVTKTLGDPAGTVRGKPALRAYFAKALAAAPDLKLEVMEVDADGRVARVLVHHRDPP